LKRRKKLKKRKEGLKGTGVHLEPARSGLPEGKRASPGRRGNTSQRK